VRSADPASVYAATAQARTALVADDDPSSRLALQSLLARVGYEVLLAVDGAQAVEQFASHGAGMVFMDLHLPGSDGLGAARRIKALAGPEFVPVIFVSGADDTADLVRGIDAGGDDFLTRPVDERVLRAKVLAFERIRSLHRRSERLHARARADWEVAQALLGEVVMGANPRSPALHAELMPTDVFSADIHLAEYSPSGDLNVLLGDFTGHGLAAALAALPTAETFRSMTVKGFAPQQILLEMNRKLAAQLPVGKFLAATFVQVSRSLRRIWVANCGMPDVLVLGARAIRERLRSSSLPLGIQPELDLSDCVRLVSVAPGERLLLTSDGVHEAVNARGEQFGRARLERVAAHHAAGDAVSALGVARALDAFRDGEPIPDDASLVEIRLLPSLFDAFSAPASLATDPAPASNTCGQWRMALDLYADALRVSDPVPMLLSQLQEIPGLDEHRAALYTVLSELYSNALEHGVLRLSSRLKDEPDGFERYVAARERQLAALSGGWVRMSAVCAQWCGGGELTIRVEDSGEGFDWHALPEQAPGSVHGRGLNLVRGLCRSLEFDRSGSAACAIYAWGQRARVGEAALNEPALHRPPRR
jgi:CheY-like chemotaxis protein